jgi:hypothetical protein
MQKVPTFYTIADKYKFSVWKVKNIARKSKLEICTQNSYITSVPTELFYHLENSVSLEIAFG